MSQTRLPPPQPEACLTTSRASRYKGGTIIAEDVWSPEEHARRMSSPDGYRPQVCGRCGNDRLHVHDYPERKPLGLAMLAALRLVRFICANPSCGATWRLLPAFLARHLWWVWRRVETATTSPATPACPTPARVAEVIPTTQSPAAVAVSARSAGGSPPGRAHGLRPVPERTRARWLGRLESSARQLVVLLATTGTATVKAIAESVHLDATRRDLVEPYGAVCGVMPGTRFASLAALVDRLERGIRFV
jgi:hypothetical protein